MCTKAGFNTTDERKITFLVSSMITAINEKDAEGYIQTLSDYFINVTYGDKEINTIYAQKKHSYFECFFIYLFCKY